MSKLEIFSIGNVKKNSGKTHLRILKKYIPALKQLEFFSHIRVFWWAQIEEKADTSELLQIKPHFKNAPLTGVFASRSYVRPNPLGLSTANILNVDYKKGIIDIDFLDAHNCSSIVDIKAYIPIEDRIKDVKCPNWISALPEWRPEGDSLLSKENINANSTKAAGTDKKRDVFSIFPIGIVRKDGGKVYLEIHSSYIPGLKQLEYFSHVQVLWWFSRLQKERFRRIKQVSPPYENAPVSGVFATRSPVRPNPIALDTVKILDVDHKKGIVEIDSIEAYDRTPFVDLKAYLPAYDRVRNVKVPEWISHWPEWRPESVASGSDLINSLRPAAVDCLGDFHSAEQETGTSAVVNPKEQGKTAEHSAPADSRYIRIRGARQHNLKNIDVEIPRLKFTVITGVSGSGKSSLAFDTIYAEGQRRYMDSLSARASRFFGRMEKPDVDEISGLNPTIAIEQKTVTKNPRSTIGTITGIADYLRVLFARIGILHCPKCGRAVKPQTAGQITDRLSGLAPCTGFRVLAPLVRRFKGSCVSILKQYINNGFTSFRIDGDYIKDLTVESIPVLKKTDSHSIELIVDEFTVPDTGSGSQSEKSGFHKHVLKSVETAFEKGNGLLIISLEKEQDILVSKHKACPYCDTIFFEINPSLFSFNSPDGMCSDCNGLGVKLNVDPDLIIADPELSLLDGASLWHGVLRQKELSGNWMIGELYAVAEKFRVDLELPWKKLPAEFQKVVLYGTGDEKLHFRYHSKKTGRAMEFTRPAQGAVNNIMRLFRQTKADSVRSALLKFMNEQPCPSCNGERLCTQARMVTIAGSRFPEIANMTIAQAGQWAAAMPQKLNADQRVIADEILKSLNIRLKALLNVGLHYIAVDRSAPSLSGGEGQRIRLAIQLGGGLTGLFYILDEPSIGLHPKDHRALLDTIIRLRDEGNTVLVVEHDADTMRAADYLIDLGPGAGVLGGKLVAAGTPKQVMDNPDSLTGRYLSAQLQVASPDGKQKRKPAGWLSIAGVRLHNLKNIDVQFPLGMFTCITGVSGSGKSSLITQTLTPALVAILSKTYAVMSSFDRIEGVDSIDKITSITQSPIGRTPRSNPATYVGVFDEIRKAFAGTADAKACGFKVNRFSFNSKEGRCEVCRGQGKIKTEMHFLPDVWVTCKECKGKRFNHKTLEVRYNSKSIADVLEMDVEEALFFFTGNPRIIQILQTLHDVGLGYIKLGQSALTLSGGEAQRIKLAKELSLTDTGRTLYILDEPTTGLHFADIQKLLDVLNRLIDAGNTVIVIEHNLDVIKTADWIVDLGPEGGDEGGNIVAQGTPEEIVKVKESYTGKYLRMNFQ